MKTTVHTTLNRHNGAVLPPFKVVSSAGRPCSGGKKTFKWDLPKKGKPGKWHTVEAPSKCVRGLHLTINPESWNDHQPGVKTKAFNSLKDAHKTRRYTRIFIAEFKTRDGYHDVDGFSQYTQRVNEQYDHYQIAFETGTRFVSDGDKVSCRRVRLVREITWAEAHRIVKNATQATKDKMRKRVKRLKAKLKAQREATPAYSIDAGAPRA